MNKDQLLDYTCKILDNCVETIELIQKSNISKEKSDKILDNVKGIIIMSISNLNSINEYKSNIYSKSN